MVLNHNQDQLFTGKVTFAGPVTFITPSMPTFDLEDGKVVCAQLGLVVEATSADTSHADRLMGIKFGDRYVATSGYLTFPNWWLSKGDPLFLGSNGFPVHNVPTAGFQQQVGIAIDEHTMLVALGQAIILI